MDNIEKVWKELNIEYMEMFSRLNYVSKKGCHILDKDMIKDKLNILISDFKEISNTMEKVCNTIDEIYANQGTIGNKINNDMDILVEHLSNGRRIFKIETC